MSQVREEKLREVLEAACRENAVIRLLRDDPQAFAERYKLSDAERQRLENSDVLMVIDKARPEANQTTTPITIVDC
ncbi:hypothetical protein Sgleb_00100 [Streptomyces glebosus]|uniref:Uncharacterized protein n=1 Tax=Streptomyces glebosus TaxID=249580 RepID=A0A640SKA1_9ACTN|nr:hypothetical protein [Streptomyces glebosus]GFE11963.1 hypothetical protein Sgleb_00100 [Streptomyces glebosus]GHG74595.1 hypothetical protein GCM10010513_48740 [Streptomyces glebosus]